MAFDSSTSRASAPARNAGPQIQVSAFKEYAKNTLQGFIDLTLPAIGLKIIGATLHQKNDSRWIGLPGRPYKEGGADKWAAILDFVDKDAKYAFQHAALAAVDAFRSSEGSS